MVSNFCWIMHQQVAAEASTTVRRLVSTGRLSELIVDRAIAAHVDLLPSAAAAGGATRRFHALVETLERLLVQRKQQFDAAFSLTSEEVRAVRFAVDWCVSGRLTVCVCMWR